MHVTSYDVCVQGYERLRHDSEVLLPVIIGPDTTIGDIEQDLKQELKVHESLDQAAAAAAVDEFLKDHLQWAFKKPNPFGLSKASEDDEPVYLFVYVET